jgi:chromosome condensin MukBEF MukE localization factor
MIPSQKFGVDQVIPPGIALYGGQYSGGDADRQRDAERHRPKLQRHRQLGQHQLADRLADAPGKTQVAVQYIPNPMDVLFGQGPV